MQDKIKYLGGVLGKYTKYAPLVLMEFHVLGIAATARYVFGYPEPEWLTVVDLLSAQISKVGFITLLVLLTTCKDWNFYQWLSFYCITALLVLNSVYKISNWDVDIYFVGLSVIVDLLFTILSLYQLTKQYNNK